MGRLAHEGTGPDGTALTVAVTGPFRANWGAESLHIRSTKGRALVAWLAIRGRPASREQAAELLWGPNGRRNLRQALYELRQLPGAEAWLSEEGERLAVHAELDTPDGVFLADLASSALPPAWREWRESAAHSYIPRQDDPLVAPLASLLAAAHQAAEASPACEVLARALGVPEAVVFRVLDRARRAMDTAQVDVSTHARLATVLRPADPEAAARHWVLAGRPEQADAVRAEAWVRALNAGDATVLDALRTIRRTRPTPQVEVALDLHEARVALQQGDPDIARDLAEDAAHAARSADLEPEEARASVLIGTLHLRAGRADEALAAFERAQAIGDVAGQLQARAGEGAVLAILGRLDDALEAHRSGLDLAREKGTPRDVARGLCNVASDQSRLGRYETALLRYREAADAAAAIGDTALHVIALVNGSVAALWSGRLGECRERVRAALTAATDAGQMREHALALGTRAELEAACGRTEEAVHWARRALDHHVRAGDRVRRDLLRADIAIYQLEGGTSGWAEVNTHLGRLDEAGRPLLAWRARLDAGLWCPHHALPELLDDLAAMRPSPLVDPTLLGQYALVAARLHQHEPLADPLIELTHRPGHLQLLAAVAVEQWSVTEDRTDLASLVAVRSEGLLPAQRRGLVERMERFRSLLGRSAPGQSSTSQ